jgi:hypothetical protein
MTNFLLPCVEHVWRPSFASDSEGVDYCSVESSIFTSHV